MTKLTAILIFSGVVFASLGWFLYKRKRLWRIITASVLWVFALLFLIGGGYSYWYHHRPLPNPIRNEILFEGITYTREIQTSPRPNVIHIVTIDLDAAGIEFLVTPGEPIDGRQLPARTTSQFLKEFGVQIAINGSFFYPFYSRFLRYYPHAGEPVDVYGLAISQGKQYSPPEPGYNTLYISRDNRVSIAQPLENPYNALSGFWIFLKDGEVQETPGESYYANKPGPRTAVAVDKTGQTLLLLVVDGRQPNYSEGMTLAELAQIALQHGADTALNLDNGGSTSLVKEGTHGNPVVLNSPIHGRVPPGRERVVANHLGIFARQVSNPITENTKKLSD
jgi:hypothetical protein